MSATLIRQIQQFYDASSGLWEQVWANTCTMAIMDQMATRKKDRRQAQIDLIEELLKWAGVQQAQNILDVGCGIGGSSLYLAHKFNATATGITLVPFKPLEPRNALLLLGWYNNSVQSSRCSEYALADASFDLVWSLESGEHMPDKIQFMQECYGC